MEIDIFNLICNCSGATISRRECEECVGRGEGEGVRRI